MRSICVCCAWLLGVAMPPAFAQTPAARIYHSMVGTEDGAIYVFAGTSKHGWTMDLLDVWAYDLDSNRWTSLGALEPGEVFGAAYDRQSRRVVAFNLKGETWAFDPDLRRWEQRHPRLAPSGRCGQGMAYDARSDRVILFGGFKCTGVSDPMLSDTWSYHYDSDTWTLLEPAVAPPARIYPQMVYHDAAQRVVLWGGRVNDSRIWTFDGEQNRWTALHTAGVPEGIRSYHTLAYDPKSQKIVVFGGLVLDGPLSFGGRMVNETWSLDLALARWTLVETEAPPARSHHTMVTHGPSGLIIVFGGELKAPYSNVVTNEVWVFNPTASTWSRP